MRARLLLAALAPSFSWVLDSPLVRHTIKEEEGYERQEGDVWQGPQSFNLSTIVSRWSLPADPFTDAELGSGISWALHPRMTKLQLVIARRHPGSSPPAELGALVALSNRPSQPARTSPGASLRDATPQGAAVSSMRRETIQAPLLLRRDPWPLPRGECGTVGSAPNLRCTPDRGGELC